MKNSQLKTIVGYATDKLSQEKLLQNCGEVVLVLEPAHNIKTFLAFVDKHKQDAIYINSLQELNLQLVQLLPVLEMLEDNQNYFRVLDKGYLNYLNDLDYHRFFLELAASEKNTIVRRTQKGLKEAVRNGIRIGRPQIDDETINKIRFLHQSQKCTVREISEICEVSLGTVYKYAFQSK